MTIHPLTILKRGIQAWRSLRAHNPDFIPAFPGVALPGAALSGVDLSYADLSRANLSGANLSRAHLPGADLHGATLARADLYQADLTGARLTNADLIQADLSGADLTGANLTGADLTDANLTATKLHRTSLSRTLIGRASFHQAKLAETVFGDVDLSASQALETVIHEGPSVVGIDTLYKSKGKIPEIFLRGAGVPEDLITYVRIHIRDAPAIEFYSCFISYSHLDEEFARKLFTELQSNKVRVWYAPEHLKGGIKIHQQIDEAIRFYDKLLVVMSDNSILSEWVVTEVKHAHRREKRENRRMLFPIRLTDYQTITEWKCYDGAKDLGDEIREYFIPDFSNWKDKVAFEVNFRRLLADLKASESSSKSD